MKRLIIGLICLALVQAAPFQAARAQAAQPTGKPFRIAMLVGLTGPSGPQQQAYVAGAQAAAKQINTEGGILGRPVQVTAFDHQFDPSRAVRQLQEDVLTQNFDMIWPGGGSATTGPMLPFIAKAKVFAITQFISTNGAQDTANYPTVFNLQASSFDVATAITQYAVKHGVKKLALVYSSDAFGISEDKTVEAALEKVGIPVVSEPYDIATVDITPTLLKLKAQNPDHLFVTAYGSPAGHVLNSLNKIGWDIPVIGDIAVGLTDLTLIVPARTYAKLIVQSLKINVYVPLSKRSPRLNAFINLIKETGPIKLPIALYAVGWDAVQLAALAARRANSAEPAKIVDALEHLHTTPRQRTFVLYDDYNFTPTNHEVQAGPEDYPFVKYSPFVDGLLGGQ